MDNNQDCSSENMISKNALLMVALISQKIATSQPLYCSPLYHLHTLETQIA